MSSFAKIHLHISTGSRIRLTLLIALVRVLPSTLTYDQSSKIKQDSIPYNNEFKASIDFSNRSLFLLIRLYLQLSFPF